MNNFYVNGKNIQWLVELLHIITEFRGSGDEISFFPLTFSEYYSVFEGDKENAWEEYIIYGGLPKKVFYLSEFLNSYLIRTAWIYNKT